MSNGNKKSTHPSSGDEDVSPEGQARLQAEIAGRRRAEQALQVSNERFRTLIENSQDMIGVLDAQATILYKSPAVERILGYTPEELVGTNGFEMVHPDDLARTRDFFSRVLQQPGVALTFTLRLRHKQEAWHPIEAIFDNLLHHPAIQGIVVNYRDLTERRIMEQQLAQAQKMEGIGQLAGGIAHDFNNLLSAILGYAGLATQELPVDSAVYVYLQNIEKAAQRAANLTRQLLAFARQQPIEPRIVNLDELITGLIAMLRRLVGEDIELVALPLARAHVRVDPGQMEQMLVNLAVNARDAMPAGGRLLIETAEVTPDADTLPPGLDAIPGAYVLLSVCDTGSGMPPHVQARIFEPFFTTKEVGKGTGLGLSMCYGMVRQNGGHILVESAPGQGTTFRIYVPRVEPDIEIPAHSDNVTPMQQGTETILLVEDDPWVRDAGVQTLRAYGYTILEATNGEEALQIVERYGGAIHLLVTDVIMPQLGGRVLSERLQAMDSNLKVLFTSGYLDDITVRHGVLEAGRHFLTKPFTPTELLIKVRSVLDT